MSNDNVIQFPHIHKSRPPQNLDELKAQANAFQQQSLAILLNNAVDPMVANLVNGFQTLGINVLDDKYAKNMLFLVEALKATLCKSHDVEHWIDKLIADHEKSMMNITIHPKADNDNDG